MSPRNRPDNAEFPSNDSEREPTTPDRASVEGTPIMRRLGRIAGRHSWAAISLVALATWGLAVVFHGGDLAAAAATARWLWLLLAAVCMLAWFGGAWLLRAASAVQQSPEKPPENKPQKRPSAGWPILTTVMVLWGALYVIFPAAVTRPPYFHQVDPDRLKEWAFARQQLQRAKTDTSIYWALSVAQLRKFGVPDPQNAPKNAVEYFGHAQATWQTRLQEAERLADQFSATEADPALVQMARRQIREQGAARQAIESLVAENNADLRQLSSQDAANLWKSISSEVAAGKFQYDDEILRGNAKRVFHQLAEISRQRAEWIAMQGRLKQTYPDVDFPLPPDPARAAELQTTPGH